MKKIRKVATFKQRKMTANGVFMSRLIYCITVWGGNCGEEMLNALQVCQNRAARAVTRNSWTVSSADTLKQCGWLNVRQLVAFFTVLQMYKISRFRQPADLAVMFDWEYGRATRAAAAGLVKPVGLPRLALARDSFRYRAPELFNQLPVSVRHCDTVQSFKLAAKKWIQDHI